MDYYQAPPIEHAYIVQTGCCDGGSCSPAVRSEKDEIKQSIKEAYGEIAQASDAGVCCDANTGCCSVPEVVDVNYALELGYSMEDLASVPEKSNMGLGCGNPQSITSLKEGNVVLDLGSGGGFDAFLSARKVGPTGKVYGVDMTPAMVKKARLLAQENGFKNVEFILGEMENLPLRDATVDVVISNCVVNLSVDKPQVFKEAFRVLKSGGRLAISDIIEENPLPPNRKNTQLYCGCISGAISKKKLQSILQKCGFTDIKITVKENSREFIRKWYPGMNLQNYVVSAYIEATKP